MVDGGINAHAGSRTRPKWMEAIRVTGATITVVGTPWRELLFLELETDAGLRGVGEVRMLNKTATLEACLGELLPRYVIGRNAFDVERISWGFRHEEYSRVGEVVQSALSAVEVACWDLVGQALGAPVWSLFGGSFRERVAAYANGWYQSARLPDEVAARASDVIDRGYRALKLDPFGAGSGRLSRRDLNDSLAVVSAVRDRVGDDVELFIEMHGRFVPAFAAEVAHALEPLRPAWLEEPVPPENPQSLRRVREAMNRTDFGGDSIPWRKMESWQINVPPARARPSGGIHRN